MTMKRKKTAYMSGRSVLAGNRNEGGNDEIKPGAGRRIYAGEWIMAGI